VKKITQPIDLPKDKDKDWLKKVTQAISEKDLHSLGILANELDALTTKEKKQFVDDELWKRTLDEVKKQTTEKEKITSYKKYLKSTKISYYEAKAQSKVYAFQYIVDEREAWSKTNRKNTIEEYENYVKQFPKSDNVQEAKERLYKLVEAENKAYQERLVQEEQEAWEKALRLNSENSYRVYLSSYPNHLHTDEAKERLSKLVEAENKTYQERLVQEEQGAWEKALRLNSENSYRVYLSSYPNHLHTDEAKEKREWKSVEKKDDILSYKKFIKNYSYSNNIEKARVRIKELKETQAEQEQIIKNEEDAWQEAIKIGSYVSIYEKKNIYEQYLKQYPYSKKAKFRLEELIKEEERYWKEAIEEHSIKAYYNYRSLTKYTGKYEEKATKYIEELEAWETATYENMVIDYEKFIKDYPNSINIEEAKQLVCEEKVIEDGLRDLISWAKKINILEVCEYTDCLSKDIKKLKKIKRLSFDSDVLDILPESIGYLSSLREISFSKKYINNFKDRAKVVDTKARIFLYKNEFTILNKNAKRLINLVKIDMRDIELTLLPEWIGLLPNLKELDISNRYYGYNRINKLTFLPEWIGNLINLTKLDIENNALTHLPKSIENLRNLTNLNIENNALTQLPNSIGNLTKLTSLDINNNSLTHLPKSIGNLTNLTYFNISSNSITQLPNSIGQLTNLTNFYYGSNKIEYLPENIGNLVNLKHFVIIERIHRIPNSICNMSKLESLTIKSNIIDSIPENIGNLKNLKELEIKWTKFTQLPESIGNLKNLVTLRLYYGSITALPESIGNLKNLKNLYIWEKNFSILPESIGYLTNLEELIIETDVSIELPQSIKNLKKLSMENKIALKALSLKSKVKKIFGK